MTLYIDDGRKIVTQSMIKTMRRCPRRYYYKYIRRLKPREFSKPLTKGKWMHSLLEAHYSGEDWKKVHKRLVQKYYELMEEERENLGDLPGECYRLMRGYVWHYSAETLNVKGVEIKLEAEMPGGIIFRIRMDLMAEDEHGLLIIDHKNMKALPDFNDRVMDVQSPMYVWTARENGLDVYTFEWNYLRTGGLKIPDVLKSGEKLARWDSCDIDYPTAVEAIKLHDVPVAPHREKLRMLKAQRFVPGAPQTSSYFRRESLERTDVMLSIAATSTLHTAKRIDSYPWHQDKAIERVFDRSCRWCEYRHVCMAEFSRGEGNIPNAMISSRYTEADPMAYYQDENEDLLT